MSWIDDAVAAELAPGAMLCPRCARHVVVEGTVAGEKYGVCEACYLRAMRDAQVRRLSDLEAKREYDFARQNVCRERKRLGIAATRGKNAGPVF